MPVDDWSDQLILVHLADDPQFSEDMESVEDRRKKSDVDVVLDFSAVRFISSSNISKLLKLRKQLEKGEGRLVLCGVGKRIMGALTITGLDKIFEFTENVPTALATLAMEKR